MITKLLETAGEGLGTRWTNAVFSPAALFWLGGALLWWHSTGWGRGVDRAEGWIKGLTTAQAVTLAVAALVVATAWERLLRLFTFGLLRLAEGYWRGPLRPVARLAECAQRRRLDRLQARFDALAPAASDGTADTSQRREYVEVDYRLSRFPTDPDDVLPTALGNTLRAAETRPVDRYGLDVVRVWPHLWLVLPDDTRTELTSTRAAVDDAALVAGALGLVVLWAPISWMAVPLGAVGAYAAYRAALLPAAARYADLIVAAVDVHHRDLYTTLKLRAPQSPAHDRMIGLFVTGYLVRGDSRPDHIFLDEQGG